MPKASVELTEIIDYIEERSPAGARNVNARIQAITEALLQYSFAGTTTNDPGMRWITTTPCPHIISYEVSADAVVVAGVRHAARDPKGQHERSNTSKPERP